MSGRKLAMRPLLVLILSGALVLLALVQVAYVPQASSSLASPTAAGTPPQFVVEPLDPTAAAYGVRVNITGLVKDVDGDALTVYWYWGDGNVNVTTTGPAGVNTIIRNGHIYTPPIQQGRGTVFEPYKENLTLRIMLDDGNGNFVNCTTLVTVTMPPNGLPVRPDIYLNGTSSTKIDPSAVVYVVANSSDPEGESLTWTYVFTNAADEIYRVAVLNTPATAPGEDVWVNISHAFGTVGHHQIDVYVSDALIPYQIFPHNLTNTKYAEVVINSIPAVSSYISVDPNEPVINATIGYKLVNFTIEAYDADGDELTVTWDFDDGTPVEVNTSAGGLWVYSFYQTRNYTEPGIFNVTVVVTDGRVGHEVYRSRTVYVNSTNRPPVLLQLSFVWSGIEPYVGEDLLFTATLTDPEEDPLELVWDFGDGSQVLTVNLTEYEAGSVVSSAAHAYIAPGTYTLTINCTDNEMGVFDHDRQYFLWFSVVVDDELPTASAGVDQVAVPGDVVWFDGTGSSDNWGIANYTWTLMHNGTEVTLWGPTPCYQFWTLGPYEVVLTVTDMAGNTNTSSIYIIVLDMIPEFSSVTTVTIAVMLALVTLIYVRGRRRD